MRVTVDLSSGERLSLSVQAQSEDRISADKLQASSEFAFLQPGSKTDGYIYRYVEGRLTEAPLSGHEW